MYYDKEGKEIDRDEWARLFGDMEYKRVAYENRGDISVSTVWLGLDHSFVENATPIIFETMIFGLEDNEPQWRYETLEQAIKGHKKAVELAFGKVKK